MEQVAVCVRLLARVVVFPTLGQDVQNNQDGRFDGSSLVGVGADENRDCGFDEQNAYARCDLLVERYIFGDMFAGSAEPGAEDNDLAVDGGGWGVEGGLVA